MIKLVVFDMAGTTVDEDNVVYKTVREAINSKGYSFSQDEVQAVGAGTHPDLSRGIVQQGCNVIFTE